MVNNKCIKCSSNIKDSDNFCEQCGAKIVRCLSCNSVIDKYIGFCGYCGDNLDKQNEKLIYEENEKQKLNNIKKDAINILIDSSGNKFVAIGVLSKKYNLNMDDSAIIINDAYSKINKMASVDNSMDNIDSSNITSSIADIVKKNSYSVPQSIAEIQKEYGYSLEDAKTAVDDVISEAKNKGKYVNPKGIYKTVIVASDSRKKATSAVARGAVGAFLLGPIGLLAGLSAKSKDTTTFQIYYNDGSVSMLRVKNNGWMFNKLCRFLER